MFQFTPPRGRRRSIFLAIIVQLLVSIHASAREATHNACLIYGICKFQFTPPRGRRRKPCGYAAEPVSFNSRLRAGGDSPTSGYIAPADMFQFTPPRGRRQPVSPNWRQLFRFQFTPPRGRRRQNRARPFGAISFNSRLRAGGDLLGAHTSSRGFVSIHASAREATYKGVLSPDVTSFNSRLRAGGDSPWISPYTHWQTVSIHASAREATNSIGIAFCALMFQFTPPRGRRRTPIADPTECSVFQFTPPRGRRRPISACCCNTPCFNSRLRAGGDLPTAPHAFHPSCFNSRLRAGGDLYSPCTPLILLSVSIHASAREAT